MKKSAWYLAATLALVATQTLRAAGHRYELDPVHSQVLFTVDHLGFSRQWGRFTGVRGTLWLDARDLAAASVSARIEAHSLYLGDAGWQNRVLSRTFLDAAHHPAISFRSERVEAVAGRSFKVHGQLTLHGITHPLVLNAHLNRVGLNPYTFQHTAGFSARTQIKRSDYGIKSLPKAVGDQIEIRLEIEATRVPNRGREASHAPT